MSNAEQVVVVKKALDLSMQILHTKTKVKKLQEEQFRVRPKEPVHQAVTKKYPEVNMKYSTLEKALPVAISLCFFIWCSIRFGHRLGAGLLFLLLLSLALFVGWHLYYFICRLLFFHGFIEKKRSATPEYKELCAKIDKEAEQKQQIADEKYLREKKEYDEVILPQYETELKDWTTTQGQKIAEAKGELERLEGELDAHYEQTKVVPLQYRKIKDLRYLYDLMSTSEYSIKEAIEVYDRQIQRDVDEAKLQAQQRANRLADEQSALLDEQNALLDEQNFIADRARAEAREAAVIAAIQRHKTNKLLKKP